MGAELGRLSGYPKEGDWPARWLQVRGFFFLVAFEAAFYIAYRYGNAVGAGLPSPFWFPDSVLLCALLVTPSRRWWLYLLAPLPIRLFSDVAHFPLWFLLVTSLIDSAKAWLLAVALRRTIRNPLHPETVQEFTDFTQFAVLIVPAASAFLGAAAHLGLGETSYWTTWQRWFVGDVLAQIIVTPAILYWVFNGRKNLRAISPERRVEGAALFLGLIVSAYLAATADPSSSTASASMYAPIPFLFWAAVRFGMFGATGAVGILACFATGAAIYGRGPFADLSADGVSRALQNFLFLRAIPIYLVAICIEQGERAQHLLRENEKRFRSMANNAPVLIWSSSRDKRCDFVNERWLEFTGRALESELGFGWTESIHPEDVGPCLEGCSAAFDARLPVEVEYRLRRRDGEYRWMLCNGMPRYAPSGEFTGFVGSAIDTTDRKRNEELKSTLGHVQRLAVMGELSAAIAHELRQPLTSILINAEATKRLLSAENPPIGEIRAAVVDIGESIVRANEVITHTRDFLTKREMQVEPIDMNAMVIDVLALATAEARQRCVHIRSELALGLAPVLGDRTQLQQVLLNLIVNGMDAMLEMPESDRKLTVRTRTNLKGEVEVEVEDGGRGIPEDGLPHLFESFFTTKKGGIGLGLSIAWSIVDAHHGRIWAENKNGFGATFRFALPAIANAPGSQRPAGSSQSTTGTLLRVGSAPIA